MHEWEIRELMCDIGRRCWQRQYVSANEGNFSVRLSENEVLTTPTLLSKGFMHPEDICKVDMQGNLISARPDRKPTSEVLMHINIYKERPDVKAVVHAHPPHATAFAVAGEPIPRCILPEVEIFVGEIPVMEYATPGSIELFETLRPRLKDHQTFLLANHGALTIGKDLIQAYYLMEIVESYCHLLLLTKQIGKVRKLEPEHMKRLNAIREQLGYAPGHLPCDECTACPASRARSTPESHPAEAKAPESTNSDLIHTIVAEILRRLNVPD